jgi:predicted solute-binding protein
MFYGFACGEVHVEGVHVEQVLADIQTLNEAAFEGRYEVTAVSFHAYAHLTDNTRCCRTAEHGRQVRAILVSGLVSNPRLAQGPEDRRRAA